jgi:hypothetical protein
MIRKHNYLVALARIQVVGQDKTVESKPVYVEARSARSAKQKALLQTPGLWNVVAVKKVKRV